MFLQQLKNITVVTVTGDLMNSSLVGGEGHVPVIAHLHFPHPPPSSTMVQGSYFPTGKAVMGGSSDRRSAGNQLRAGIATSLGLARAGREQGKG